MARSARSGCLNFSSGSLAGLPEPTFWELNRLFFKLACEFFVLLDLYIQSRHENSQTFVNFALHDCPAPFHPCTRRTKQTACAKRTSTSSCLLSMILQYVKKLNTHRIVLASKSPRRKEILENIGLGFDVCPTRTLMPAASLMEA